MATFDTGYDVAAEQELYQTDAFSGTDADLDNTAPVDETDGYTSDIVLTDDMIAALSFEFLGNNSTDDLVLTLFKRVKSTWTDNEIALWSVTISNDGSQDVYTGMEIGEHRGFGPGTYRVAMQSSDSNTTFDMDALMTRTKYTSVEQ